MLRYLSLTFLLAFFFNCFSQKTVQVNPDDLISHHDLSVANADSNPAGDNLVTEVAEISNNEIVPPENSDIMTSAMEGTAFDYKSTKCWGRYEALRTAGWACLGVGVGFFVGGYYLIYGTLTTKNDKLQTAFGITGVLTFFSGPILVAASIPLLSIAYYNRYKAKHMKFDVGVSSISPAGFFRNRYSTPAVSFALNF